MAGPVDVSAGFWCAGSSLKYLVGKRGWLVPVAQEAWCGQVRHGSPICSMEVTGHARGGCAPCIAMSRQAEVNNLLPANGVCSGECHFLREALVNDSVCVALL